MIISRTPFRISFFGGGTDYPAWYRENGGAVLASTIDKYCYISCRELPPFFEHRYRVVYSLIENAHSIDEIKHPSVRATLQWAGCHDRGLEIHHDGDLPARSGLGSSSSFTVGLVNTIMALQGKQIAKEDMAKHAHHIEQVIIQENVGSQDQIMAAIGGFNHIEFLENGTFKITPMILSTERYDAFQDHLMLFFTGLSRTASEIAQHQINNIKNRIRELQRMHDMVDEARSILQSNATPLTEFGKLLHEGWQYKKSLSEKISTPSIDELYEHAIKAGAIGGKLTGAGSGGFLMLFVEPKRQLQVRTALTNLIHVPFRFENDGSRIVLYKPNGLR